MTFLSEEQHAFFVENGYVTVSGVVPPENLQATIKAICEFLKIDPEPGEPAKLTPLGWKLVGLDEW